VGGGGAKSSGDLYYLRGFSRSPTSPHLKFTHLHRLLHIQSIRAGKAENLLKPIHSYSAVMGGGVKHASFISVFSPNYEECRFPWAI